jgi:mono/diheme cytochrome c family protein
MKWLKLVLGVVGGLVVLLIVAVVALYAISSREINKTYSINPPEIAIPTDSASLERGKHLATAIGKCGDCHGDDLSGKTFLEDKALGNIYGANLTVGKGGIGSRYSDADFVRTIRFGVKPNGQSLIFMPTRDYAEFSDEDLGALIAYLRSIPPVDKEMKQSSLGPLGRFLLIAKQVPEILPTRFVSQDVAPKPAVQPGVTVEYGKYLANTGGCTGCHGPTLAGGPVPGAPPEWPPAANLTPSGIAGSWTEEDFFRALREGLRPDKTVISAIMPWKYTRLMTDDEIRAVWLYLKSVPPAPTGESQPKS